MNSISGSTDVYTDFQALDDLRLSASKNNPDALEAAAKQFEAIFIQQMLKSMRDASLSEGMFDSEEGKFYQDMFDKQISLSLTKERGIGLADMIIQQMKTTVKSTEHPDEQDSAVTKHNVNPAISPGANVVSGDKKTAS